MICSKETFLQYLINISYCTNKHFFSQYCFWDSVEPANALHLAHIVLDMCKLVAFDICKYSICKHITTFSWLSRSNHNSICQDPFQEIICFLQGMVLLVLRVSLVVLAVVSCGSADDGVSWDLCSSFCPHTNSG